MAAAATPDLMPVVWVKGTTARWRFSDSDYPANDGWSKALYLRGPSTASNSAATVSGGEFQYDFSATETAALRAGDYDWQEFSRKGNLRIRTGFGKLTVEDDLQTISAGMKSRDARTSAKAAFQTVSELLADRTTLMRMPPETQAQLLDTWKALKFQVDMEAEREAVAAGNAPSNKVYVRFTA